MSHRKKMNKNSKCGQNNMRVNKIMTEFLSFCTLALDTEISVSAMKITMVQTLDKALYGLTRPDHRADIKCVLV